MCEVHEKYADTIRKLIEHENIVQNFRFTWFMGSEGFLFAMLGFAWDRGTPLVILVALLGLLISVSAHVACLLSDKAYAALDQWWNANLGEYRGPPRKGYEFREARWRWGFLLPHQLLPYILGGAWIVVIAYRLYSM